MNQHTNPQSIKGQDEVTPDFEFEQINKGEESISPTEFNAEFEKIMQQGNEAYKRKSEFPN
jgi:hypothetical protein